MAYQINVKFPDGMSDRDKEIIKRQFLESCRDRPVQSQEEAYVRFHAFIGEWFTFLGVKRHRPGE